MKSGIDYNLLKVLILINQYRNLKKVASILGKTESAISKYLAKMRVQIGDPLFVRTSDGLEPTHVLLSLLPSINTGLATIDSALLNKKVFSPEDHVEPIRVAIHSAVISHYAADIYTAIRSSFPKPVISLETWSESTEHSLLEGKIQIGIHFMHQERIKSIYQSKLVDTTLVAAVSSTNPISTWEEVLDSELIFFTVNDLNHSRQYFLDHCRNKGITLKRRVITDDITTAIRLASKEDMVFISLKRLINTDKLKMIDIPESFQFMYPMVSCIRLANRQNPLHLQLDRIIKEVIV